MMDDAQKQAEEARAREKRDKVLNWLCCADPTVKHAATRELHQPGSNQWALDHADFVHWKQTPGQTLWLHGIPGAGKTGMSRSFLPSCRVLVSVGATAGQMTEEQPCDIPPASLLILPSQSYALPSSNTSSSSVPPAMERVSPTIISTSAIARPRISTFCCDVYFGSSAKTTRRFHLPRGRCTKLTTMAASTLKTRLWPIRCSTFSAQMHQRKAS